MTEDTIKLYVVETNNANFDEIRNKVNASLAQFNVEILTELPKYLKVETMKKGTYLGREQE